MEQQPRRRRHIIRRMCDLGDAVTTWETGEGIETDEEAQAAVREAERIFKEALGRGDIPFMVRDDAPPRKLDRWDAQAKEAEEIVIAPRLMGG